MVLLVLAATGVTKMLGAHPFWAMQVVWIGLAFGAGMRVFTWRFRTRRAAVLSVLILGLIVSVAVTVIGKDRFVTSFAEDFVGGRMWYYGWMAICGFGYALIWQVSGRWFCR